MYGAYGLSRFSNCCQKWNGRPPKTQFVRKSRYVSQCSFRPLPYAYAQNSCKLDRMSPYRLWGAPAIPRATRIMTYTGVDPGHNQLMGELPSTLFLWIMRNPIWSMYWLGSKIILKNCVPTWGSTYFHFVLKRRLLEIWKSKISGFLLVRGNVTESQLQIIQEITFGEFHFFAHACHTRGLRILRIAQRK